MAERVLVTGGVRAGKSTAAAELVADSRLVLYVATGQASDEEMAERIAAHQAERPSQWTTVESCDLAGALAAAPAGAAVVIDALAGWLAAQMTLHGLWAEPDPGVAPLGVHGQAAFEAVVAEAERVWELAAAHDGGPVVLVADESGLGVTPADPSSRRWLDLAGVVIRRLGAAADRVLLCVAGHTIELPGSGHDAGAVAGGLSTAWRDPPPARQTPAGQPGRDPPSTLVEPPPADPPAAAAPLRGAERSAGSPAQTEAPPSTAAPAAVSRAHGDTMVGEGALDFAVNVYGSPPAHVRRAIDAADPAAYPDDTRARRALAGWHGRAPAETLVTAGAAEAFWLLPRVVAARHACVVHPMFTEPEAALRAAGVPVTRVFRSARQGWRVVPDAVPDDADLVVLGNPNNPTGALDDPDQLAALTRPGRLTIVDEAFMDFVPGADASLAGRADLPGVVVVRSVTKLWGLAGVRAGYLFAPPGLVARCRAARQPWPVAGPALAALEACAGGEAHRRGVAEQVAGQRTQLAAGLGALAGVTVYESAANFLLLRLSDGPAAVAGLAEAGVAVRPATFPGLDEHHVRVAVRDEARNQVLVKTLAGVLDGAAMNTLEEGR